MQRITISLTDEQQEWVDRIARERDGTRSDVIQETIDTYREGSGSAGGDSVASTDESQPGRAGDHRENGRSEAELLDRIEKLERNLEGRSEHDDQRDDDQRDDDHEYGDDDAVGWR